MDHGFFQRCADLTDQAKSAEQYRRAKGRVAFGVHIGLVIAERKRCAMAERASKSEAAQAVTRLSTQSSTVHTIVPFAEEEDKDNDEEDKEERDNADEDSEEGGGKGEGEDEGEDEGEGEEGGDDGGGDGEDEDGDDAVSDRTHGPGEHGPRIAESM